MQQLANEKCYMSVKFSTCTCSTRSLESDSGVVASYPEPVKGYLQVLVNPLQVESLRSLITDRHGLRNMLV